MTGEILRFVALQLGADAETIHAYASRQQTVSEHQQRIGQYLRLRAFDAAADERLVRFLEAEALRLERTASLLARARAWLRDEHVLAPADSVLRRAIGAARHKARALLTQRMAERLSAPMRDRLDALIAVDDDQPHSPLHHIKASSSSPSVGGMKRLLARLALIEATGVLEIDVGWVNGNYQRILFHSVRTASADRVRRMAAPRRHLALVCFLHQAWRDTLDQAVDMYGKLLDRNRKLVEDRLDDMLKAQRHAVDRIVHRYQRLGAVLLDPDLGDAELRARLLSTVPETQLREDQSDLANWTRGDRKAPRQAQDARPLTCISTRMLSVPYYQLRTLVPSFNVATHPISDAATLVRPASIRNLAHDHTLVLVNGKRRHRSSVIAWFAGVTDGSQGPDISTIPTIALRQVEVLRDSARPRSTVRMRSPAC